METIEFGRTEFYIGAGSAVKKKLQVHCLNQKFGFLLFHSAVDFANLTPVCFSYSIENNWLA